MSPSPDDTAHRLLEAAKHIFVAHGFARASVRDITRHAGVNVAAVNYHFGDKAGLYAAVVRAEFRHITDQMATEADPHPDLHRFLEGLYRTMLVNYREGTSVAFHQLLAQEEAAPSGVLGPLLAEVVKPRHTALTLRVAHALGLAAPTLEVHRLVKALLDIGKGYVRDRDVLSELTPALFEGEDWLERTVQSLKEQALDLIRGAQHRHPGAPACV